MQAGLGQAEAYAPGIAAVRRDDLRDTRWPQAPRQRQVQGGNARGGRAAQQAVLGATRRVHHVLGVKDDAQATAPGQLLKAEERGTRRQTAEGDRSVPPGRTEALQPNLRDIPVRSREYLQAR